MGGGGGGVILHFSIYRWYRLKTLRAKDRSLRDLGKKSDQLEVWPFQYHPLLSVFQEINGKITGNKTFWKKIQPIFSENLEIANKITCGW